jgi:UDP-N-acetylglucosamine:LPS N-acetylglucosamine transferase
VLAVASGGGHWEELMLLRPALDGQPIVFATTNRELAARDGLDHVHLLPDSNRDEPANAISSMVAAARLVWRVRPQVLVTTGALPGLFCLIFARLLGAHTIWIDSIANSDQPSLSGRCARAFAHEWFTQWSHLATATRRFEGALL